jgi:uncharacterized protein (UPF0276 family)
VPGAALEGAGLGLRRSLLEPLLSARPTEIGFLEIAPENWIGVGGRLGKQLRAVGEIYPLALHGLSLDIGGPRELDWDLVGNIRQLIREFSCPVYSEHLSWCGDSGHLYDLLPLPFTEEAVAYVAERVSRVQDFLGRRIALENASYYAAPVQDLGELEFINAVLDRSDCELLLDVNNIYVNSINHGYDAREFLEGLPVKRARYIHIAGHYVEARDLRVDTHGADVIDPVWELLSAAYQRFGPLPTLLERDFNIPPLSELLGEVHTIRHRQQLHDRAPVKSHVARA